MERLNILQYLPKLYSKIEKWPNIWWPMQCMYYCVWIYGHPYSVCIIVYEYMVTHTVYVLLVWIYGHPCSVCTIVYEYMVTHAVYVLLCMNIWSPIQCMYHCVWICSERSLLTLYTCSRYILSWIRPCLYYSFTICSVGSERGWLATFKFIFIFVNKIQWH